MFEGILEKILLNYFGKYVNDINKNDLSLGIMKGDITISNVSLKQEVMQLIELPLELRFSHVQKLMISIPWKQIFSEPVKICIDNLFAIVTPKEEWDLSQIHSFEKKQSQIDQFVLKLINSNGVNSQIGKSNIQSNQSNGNGANSQTNHSSSSSHKSGGFIDRLMARIIDNVQIVITNIHVRLEYSLEKPFFACGIFLRELKIQTMEEDYKTPKYFNRSAKGNKDKPIYKLVELSSLTAYWNTHESSLWHVKDQRRQCKRLLDLLEGRTKADLMIQVDLLAKITINLDRAGWKKPELEVGVEFEETRIHISNRQLQDILKLIDLFNQYSTAIEMENGRYKLLVPDIRDILSLPNPSERRDRLLEFKRYVFPQLFRRCVKKIRFKAYFLEIFNSKRAITDVLSPQRFKEYASIITTVDLKDDLYEWITSALNLGEKQKQSGISSYFSYLKFWDNSNNSSIAPDKLKPPLQESFLGYLNDQVRLQRIQELQPSPDDTSEQPAAYISFRFTLHMNRGSTKVSRITHNSTLEQIVLTWHDLSIKFNRSRQTNRIEMQIFDVSLAMNLLPSNQTELSSSHASKKLEPSLSSNFNKSDAPFIQSETSPITERSIQLVRKVYKDIKEPLVSLEIEFEKNISTDIVQSIILQSHVQSTEFIYYPSTIKQILQLLQISKQQSSYQRINLLARKKIDKISTQSIKRLEGIFEGEKTIDILVNIKSPFIVVPFHVNRTSECWLLDLGDILITYHEQRQGDIEEKKYYDQFSITIENIQMQFYRTLEMCNEYLQIQSKHLKASYIENQAGQYNFANKVTISILFNLQLKIVIF